MKLYQNNYVIVYSGIISK